MRIQDKFEQLKKKRKKAFIAYVPFGYPSCSHTKDILLTLQEAGVDIIELGIPFSDPLADGPIIQDATSLALKHGANPDKLFSLLEDLKGSLRIPLVIMTYYNPLLHYGMERFFSKMKKVNISGLMVVDLPIEESKLYTKCAAKYDLETVFFITPTTGLARAKKIAKASKGFIYYVSVTGITGPKDLGYAALKKDIRKLKEISRLPICVGFGIHTPKQVDQILKISDGAIVGSGIVKFIADHFRQDRFLPRFKNFVSSLCIK
ncbi:MAG: tryptophan synthase subunit alpha [Candidatus Omnitrophota bacterium]|nr:MAG: tryptophan synthase subunit alpha [Candidatus Omnitrophota bacterium]